MFLIDKLSYNNSLKLVHPVEKFLFSMGALGFVLSTSNPVLMLSIFLITGVIITALAKIDVKIFLKLLCVPAAFIFLSAATLVVEINPDAAGYVSVSRESLISGGVLCLKAFSSVSCMYLFILTTPVADVEYILKKMGLPVIFREIFMMVYRFIFITVERAGMIAVSQMSRGGYSSLKNRVRSCGMLASSVFVKSFFFSKASYQAMLSRGYTGELKVIEPEYRCSTLNTVIIASFYLSFIFLVIRFG